MRHPKICGPSRSPELLEPPGTLFWYTEPVHTVPWILRRKSQRLQNLLIKEDTLSYNRNPKQNLRYIPYLRGFGVSGIPSLTSKPVLQKPEVRFG